MGAAVTRVVFVILGVLGVGLAGLLVSEALHRRSERRRRVVPVQGRPRPHYAHQVGQLGILPFTRHPNGPPVVLREGFTRHPALRREDREPTAKELDNLWRMVNEHPPSPTLRPQDIAVFRGDTDAEE